MGDNNFRDADSTLSEVEYILSHKNNNPMDHVDITNLMISQMVVLENSIRDYVCDLLAQSKDQISIKEISNGLRNLISKEIYF